MVENRIAACVIDSALEIHKEVGPGLLESVYEVLLADALLETGFAVERQKSVPIHFRGKTFAEGFRADLVIEEAVLVGTEVCRISCSGSQETGIDVFEALRVEAGTID